MTRTALYTGVLLSLLAVGCALEPEPPPLGDEPSFAGHAPMANLQSERVARFDPTIDYFPDKVTFTHATNVRVDYHRHYKVATIALAGMAGQRQQVLMVQRGTPRPSGYPDAAVVWVPVRRWSAQNYHYGGIADLLGVADRIVSLGGNFVQATSPGIVQRIAAGKIRQHRSEEQAAALEPDVFIHWTPYLANMRGYDWLRALGTTTLLPVERLEETPLGRTEWIKFFALLFNKERAATAHFDRVAAEYERLVALARTARTRPRVVLDIPAGGAWQMVGGRNAAARMIADAGGEFVFADNDSVSNQERFSIEEALDRGLDADVWLITDSVAGRLDLPSVLATNPYTRQLPMLARGTVYLKHRGAPGAPNPYWDFGLPHPHHELADHIKLLHPELLPDHVLVFHQSLGSWAGQERH